jgi:hypothetical protein
MALRRDSLGAKLRCYATLERSEGRYVLADLGIRHGAYAAIPSELNSDAARRGTCISKSPLLQAYRVDQIASILLAELRWFGRAVFRRGLKSDAGRGNRL